MKKTKEKNAGKFLNDRKKKMLRQASKKNINSCGNDDAFEEGFYGYENEYENLHYRKVNEDTVEIDEEYAGLR